MADAEEFHLFRGIPPKPKVDSEENVCRFFANEDAYPQARWEARKRQAAKVTVPLQSLPSEKNSQASISLVLHQTSRSQSSGGSISSTSSTPSSSVHQFSGGSIPSKSSTPSSSVHKFSGGPVSSKNSTQSSSMHSCLQYGTQVDRDAHVSSWISNAEPDMSGMDDIQEFKDNFTEEPIEEIPLEWDCSSDKIYDITCHGNEVDIFYWADISKMHHPISPGRSFGDIAQEPYIQNLPQDQNSSSQRIIWVPFKENVPCRENSDNLLSTSSSSTDYLSCFDSDDESRENLDDFLSPSSSSTDYFSCFDSDSDDESEKEWRHVDVDFSDLSLCLNISVSHKQKDPQIVIATKAKKKQSPRENSRWISEEIEEGDKLFDTTVSSSSLHVSDDMFIDFSGMQSMISNQNNISVMRYRLVHIPDMEYSLDDEFPIPDMEYTLDDEFPIPDMENTLDDEFPIPDMEDTLDDEFPIPDMEYSLDDEFPIPGMENTLDDEFPIPDMEDTLDDEFPIPDIEYTLDDEFPIPDMEDTLDDEFPIPDMENTLDDEFPMPGMENTLDDEFPIPDMEDTLDDEFPIPGMENTLDDEFPIPDIEYTHDDEFPIPDIEYTLDDEFPIPDMEYTLDDEFPESEIKDAMPSWCQVFKPLDEVSEDAFIKRDVKSLVHSFENLIKTEEEECKASCMRKRKTNHVDVIETALEKQVEKNLRTNTVETISTFSTRCEEFSEECFQISESIMDEIITKLELDSKTNMSTLGAGQVMFNDTAMDFEKSSDKIIKRSSFLNMEEDIEAGKDIDSGEMKMELALGARQVEDKTTKLAIQTDSLITESREQVRNIVYTKEESVFPQSIPVMIEKYCEHSEERFFDQVVTLSSGDIDPVTLSSGNIDPVDVENASSNTEQQLEWSTRGQIVFVEDSLLKIPHEYGTHTMAPSKTETSYVWSEQALEWTHFSIVAANDISQMTAKEQVNNTIATLNEDTGVKHCVLKKKLVAVKPVENGSVRPPIQGDGRKENTKWHARAKITPVEKVCLKTVRMHKEVKYHYSPIQIEKNEIKQDKQDLIVDIKGISIPGPKKEYGDDLLEFQRKPLVTVQTNNGYGLMDERKLWDGNITKHTREEISGTVTKYTQMCRSNWSQENPQMPQQKLAHVRKISGLFQRIEKFCDGKTVHLQQEYTVHERQCNMRTDRFSFSPGNNEMENSSRPPEGIQSKTTPMISITYGVCKVKKSESEWIPSSREGSSMVPGKIRNESHGYRPRSKALKLQYKSNESTVTVEYCHMETTNKRISSTNKEHEQDQSFRIPHRSSENHKPLPISNYSKTIVEGGKIVYRNIKSSDSQIIKVEKVCEFSKGSRSNVPRITYRISQEGVTPARNQQPAQSFVRKDEDVQASSYMKGRSGKFDLNRYVKNRGENKIIRKNYERHIRDESYYHTAKMLAIRAIANAKLDISRESLEDYAKESSAEPVVPFKTTFAPSSDCHSNTFHQKICSNQPKEHSQYHSTQVSKKTKSERKWDRENKPVEGESLREKIELSDKYRTEKCLAKDYGVDFESTQSQRRPKVWREEASRRDGHFPNSPVFIIDLKEKHVHFNV